MGSYGLDTKKTLSVNDITPISPIMLLLFVLNSLFFLCLCVLSISEHTACMRNTQSSFFKMYPILLTACWEHSKEATLISLCKRREKRNNKPHRRLWKVYNNQDLQPKLCLRRLWWTFHISLSFTAQERQRRIKSHALLRVVTN